VNLPRKEVKTIMLYEKPEVSLLGKAPELIQGEKQGLKDNGVGIGADADLEAE